jgi:hypothetical protein
MRREKNVQTNWEACPAYSFERAHRLAVQDLYRVRGLDDTMPDCQKTKAGELKGGDKQQKELVLK